MVLLTDPCAREAVLTPDECARLVSLFEAAPGVAPARLAGGVESGVRVCRALWLDDLGDSQSETAWVFARLARLVADVNRETFRFDLDDFREGVQILRYDAPARGHAAGQYDTHVDIGGSGHSSTRKLSISIQLSPPEAYDGGDLLIDLDGAPWPAPRDQGAAVLFPSFVRHRVAPVKDGTRHALVAWVHGPAFR